MHASLRRSLCPGVGELGEAAASPSNDGGAWLTLFADHCTGLSPIMELALDCSCPRRHDEVGISGLAALLPHQHGDLPAMVDAVKSDVQSHVV